MILGAVLAVFAVAVYASHTAPIRTAKAAALADAEACAEVGEPRKMVALCGRAIATGMLPDDVLVLTYSNRAFAYVNMELFANALRDYGAALRINSSDAVTYAGRAQVNNLMNNW